MSKCTYYAPNHNLSKQFLDIERVSKGPLADYTSTKTDQFRNWNKGSVILDANREPVVMHISEDYDFSEYDAPVVAHVDPATPDAVPAHLSLTNPFYTTEQISSEKANELFEKGYDGVIVNDGLNAARQVTPGGITANRIIVKDTRKVRTIGAAKRRFEGTHDVTHMDRQEQHSVERLAEKMTEAFEDAGVPVKVIIEEDPIDSQIQREGDYNVIRISRSNLNASHVYHEFAHLYIDILGLNDPVIQKALEELEDTDLYKKVRNRYDNLFPSEDMERSMTFEQQVEAHEHAETIIAKEVLAHAIDRYALQLEKVPKNSLRYWLREIIRKIGKVLGIQEKASIRLARELMNRRFRINNQRLHVDERYYKLDIERSAPSTKLHRTALKAIESIDKKARIYGHQNDKLASGSRQLHAELTELMAEGKQDIVAAQIIAHIESDTMDINQRLNDMVQEYDDDPNYYPDPHELEQLYSRRAGYKDFLEEFGDVIIQSVELQEFNEDLDRSISRSQSRLKNIEDLHDQFTEILVSKQMLPLQKQKLMYQKMNQWRQEYKEKHFAANSNKLGMPLKEFERKAQEYARKKAQEYNDQELSKEALVVAKNLLRNADYDITSAQQMLVAPNMITEPLINSLYQLITQAEDKTRADTIAVQRQLDKLNKELIKAQGNITDPVKKYDFMLEDEVIENENGELVKTGKKSRYYVTKYYSGFKEKHDELTRAIDEAEYGSEQQEQALDKLVAWLENNTQKTPTGNIVPTDKWKNPQYDRLVQDGLFGKSEDQSIKVKVYKAIQLLDKTGDNHVRFAAQITNRQVPKVAVKWWEQPTVRANTTEMLSRNDVKAAIQDKLRRLTPWKVEYDEMAYGGVSYETNDDGKVTRVTAPGEISRQRFVLTDVDGKEKKFVPIYFRGKLEKSNEYSYDVMNNTLLNSWMTSNARYKREIEPMAKMMLDQAAKRNYNQYDRSGKILKDAIKRKNNKQKENPKDWEREEQLKSGDETKVYKSMEYLINSRIYGEMHTDDPRVAKAMDAISSYASNLALMLNHFSITASLYQGQTLNFIESTTARHFGKKSLLKAHRHFWSNIKGVVNDWGKITPTGRTNLIMEHFNGYQNWSPFNYGFQDNKVALKTMQGGALHAPRNQVENYIQAVPAFAVLEEMKGIDTEGNIITDDQGNEMSMLDLIDTSNGIVEYDKRVASVQMPKAYEGVNVPIAEFQSTGSQYIQAVFTSMQGNYSAQHREEAKKAWYGRMLLSMRGWMVPMFETRWKGLSRNTFKGKKTERELYNPFLGEEREGAYVTSIRFVRGLMMNLKEHQAMFLTKEWSLLSSAERSSVVRAVGDVATMAIAYSAFMLLDSLAGDEEDERSPSLVYLAYLNRRLVSETATFNVFALNEAVRTVGSPAVSYGALVKVTKLINQIFNPMEEYVQGDRKGQLKVWKRFVDMIPAATVFNASPEDYLSWYSNLR